MSRLVTLFTGQFGDLSLESVCALAASSGYGGLELSCNDVHFDVSRALSEQTYCDSVRSTLRAHGLQVVTISNHCVGQCVADAVIDDRHKKIVPARVWGDGEAEGVRQRAAKEMIDTARAARAFGVKRVVGFCGSPIWQLLYAWPPHDAARIDAGYEEFGKRWGPIIDAYAELDVDFCLEVHPTEIAYDFVTAKKTLEAIKWRKNFCFNLDPSHFIPQFLDPAEFAREFADRIRHVHIKDAKRRLNGRRSILGSHLPFGSHERGWDFVSPGHGDVDFSSLIRALNDIHYEGPLSVEWEDNGMDRTWGIRSAIEFVRTMNFAPSKSSFEDLMKKN